MTLISMSAAEAVANGAQLLDEKRPGWYDLIDLDKLNVANDEVCICGQLEKYEAKAMDIWDLVAKNGDQSMIDKGVYRVWDTPWTYAELTVEWKKAIQARREADKLRPTVEEKEAVLA